MRVERAFLPHRLADPLGDAAMALSMHDQRVDAAPDIVDDGIAGGLDPARLRINLYLADRTAIGEDRVVHLIVGDDCEPALQTVESRLLRQLEKIEAAIGARRCETAILEGDLVRRRFEDAGGNSSPLGDQL